MDGTAGAAEGTTVASTEIKNPGPQPVAFELAYPFSQIKSGDTYRLYAGIVDGDLAWVTPIGVQVAVPQPLIEGVVLPLEYRPDLLKAAVTGTITGVGLDPARDPDSYGTSLVIEVNTGATIGFQLIEPAGAAPVPYSVPFDPSTITPRRRLRRPSLRLGRDDAVEHAGRRPGHHQQQPQVRRRPHGHARGDAQPVAVAVPVCPGAGRQ